MGGLYYGGNYVEKNINMEFDMFKESAEQGNSLSRCIMSGMIKNGEYIE